MGTPKHSKATPRPLPEKKSRPRILPTDGIMNSTNLPQSKAATLARSLARKGNFTKTVVVALDIRDSTTFMLHVEDFDTYARILSNFITFVKVAATDRGGWFDKFTGDGALVFWTVPDGLSAKLLAQVLDFAILLQIQFMKTTIPDLRIVAGCMPAMFGLAIGIDYGRCLVSDLRPDPNMKIDGKSIQPTSVQNSITVLGRPVVGAVRMVSAASHHEILLNEGPGEFWLRLWQEHAHEHPDRRIERVLVPNKDIRGDQFAYRYSDDQITQAVAANLQASSSRTS
jgi:class 3 adenylate cyclase